MTGNGRQGVKQERYSGGAAKNLGAQRVKEEYYSSGEEVGFEDSEDQ